MFPSDVPIFQGVFVFKSCVEGSNSKRTSWELNTRQIRMEHIPPIGGGLPKGTPFHCSPTCGNAYCILLIHPRMRLGPSWALAFSSPSAANDSPGDIWRHMSDDGSSCAPWLPPWEQSLSTPRRDNSKSNIIDLFNTNRVYQLM